MPNLKQPRSRYFSRAILFALALVALVVAGPGAEAQTYRVLHNFTDGTDGSMPSGNLLLDRAENIYGTAADSIYKMTRYGSNFIFNPLYIFHGGQDGRWPEAGVIFGPDGNLYGTTNGGGNTQGSYCSPGGCGVVYRLRPPATTPPSPFTQWTETTLYEFTGPPADGYEPRGGSLIFDTAGNLYGTTEFGGSGSFGTVFKLSPSNGEWYESVLYGFSIW